MRDWLETELHIVTSNFDDENHLQTWWICLQNIFALGFGQCKSLRKFKSFLFAFTFGLDNQSLVNCGTATVIKEVV